MMKHEDYLQWVYGLREGDEVVTSAGGTWGAPRIGKVTRVTTTQIVVDSGRSERRYNRSNGRFRGEGYSILEPATDAVREKIELMELGYWISTVADKARRKEMPLQVLRAMKSAYNEANK